MIAKSVMKRRRDLPSSSSSSEESSASESNSDESSSSQNESSESDSDQMSLHGNDQKYLIYESQIEQSVDDERSALHSNNDAWFWSERIILIEGEHIDEFWNFQAFDLLTTESRAISFPKSGSQFDWVQVIPLIKNYGFILENSGDHHQFNLIKIHWKTNEIQVFEHFERHNYDEIFVDKLQPSKFVLALDYTHEVCKLNENGKIEFCDVHELDDYFEHYSNDKLYWFTENDVDLLIRTYDLLSRKTQLIQVEKLAGYHVSVSNIKWINNRVYAGAVSRNENKFGIACVDSETKRLTLLDLTTTLDICGLNFFDGKLIAYAKDSNEQDGILTSTVEVHSIPIHRPHSLRQMSWLIVVQQMKDSGESNPYKAASRYLPFNTDIRPPWFTDEVDSQDEASNDQDEEKPDQNAVEEDAMAQDKNESTEAIKSTLEQDSKLSSQESIDDLPLKRPKLN